MELWVDPRIVECPTNRPEKAMHMLVGMSNEGLNDMQANSYSTVVEASGMPLAGVPTLGYL
ncbi:tRNA pseudouridine synthase [Aspergillus luchuensis]|uniref:tRNA pseudouridine synthase n=1 Tax=Aspergillus kawachii TaxID=1069201 RepID=A0A146F580_ASPKA|nr:tRNA pseudouridine synthase [Aspergillus luchuensis]